MKDYSYLKRVEMPVEKLRIGMYVAKLDKDWKDSPFLFQGFPIEDKHQLDLLRKECKNVFVDFKTQEEYDVFLLAAGSQVEVEEDLKQGHEDVALVEELPHSLATFKTFSKVVKVLMRQVMQKKEIDLSAVESNVADCITSLKRYQEALLLTLNMKNKIHYISEHNLRVSILSMAFGLELGMSDEQLRILGISATLHDVGKGMLPDKLLNKPGKLNKDEIMVLREHPKESFRVLSKIDGLSSIVKEVALSHHEREDGKGYPRHIPKDRVSRFAKLVSIVDAYDAITSDRSYGAARSPSFAFKVLNEGKGKKFDPQLVERFIKWIGITPVGSLVEMTSGEIGIVLKNHPEKALSPRIMLVTDELKKTGYERIIDLSKMVIHPNGEPYKIKSVIANRAYGINIQRYLEQDKFGVVDWCNKPDAINNSPFARWL